MGIKLKLFAGLFYLIFMMSCKTQQHERKTEEDYYVEAYKSAVFSNCFNETTNRDLNKVINDHNDLGGYTDVEILLHATYEEAAAKGKGYAQTIKPVSLPDADNKIPGYRDCFRYAMSKEIDSIARAEYKKFRKSYYSNSDSY